MPQSRVVKTVRRTPSTVKDTLADQDIVGIFQGALGGGDVSPPVAWKKYNAVKTACRCYVQILVLMSRVTVLQSEVDLLQPYAERAKEGFEAAFCAPDLSSYRNPMHLELARAVGQSPNDVEPDFEQVPPETLKEFIEVFKRVTSAPVVLQAIATCNNLLSYRRHIQNEEQLSDVFLRGAGSLCNPLDSLDAFNFKRVYFQSHLGDSDRHFILKIMSRLYKSTHDVYEAASMPDMDVDDFVQVVQSAMVDVRKQIPRCEEAFRKIEESIGTLKDNFGQYYRDYISTSDPSIIMQNFVTDVAKDAKGSGRLAQQFRTIISHYRKMAAQQSNDPQMRALFRRVDENFKALEQHRRQVDAEDDEA